MRVAGWCVCVCESHHESGRKVDWCFNVVIMLHLVAIIINNVTAFFRFLGWKHYGSRNVNRARYEWKVTLMEKKICMIFLERQPVVTQRIIISWVSFLQVRKQLLVDCAASRRTNPRPLAASLPTSTIFSSLILNFLFIFLPHLPHQQG